MAGDCYYQLRSNFISSFNLLHVATVNYLFENALIQKVLDIEFRYFGITQGDDLLDGFQAFCGNEV